MSEKIVTNYDPKPIPDRRYDWSATSDNYEASYEEGRWVGSHPIGYGSTLEEAVQNYRELCDGLWGPLTEND